MDVFFNDHHTIHDASLEFLIFTYGFNMLHIVYDALHLFRRHTW